MLLALSVGAILAWQSMKASVPAAPTISYTRERVVNGHVSTGAADDLKKATQIAEKMVAHWGMSEAMGPMYREHKGEHPFLGKRMATDGGVSDRTIRLIEEHAQQLLEAARDDAEDVIRGSRATLDQLVEMLLAEETLEAERLEEVLDRAPVSDAQVRERVAS